MPHESSTNNFLSENLFPCYHLILYNGKYQIKPCIIAKETEKFMKQTRCLRGTFYSTFSYQIGRSQIKELVNTIIIVKL